MIMDCVNANIIWIKHVFDMKKRSDNSSSENGLASIGLIIVIPISILDMRVTLFCIVV